MKRGEGIRMEKKGNISVIMKIKKRKRVECHNKRNNRRREILEEDAGKLERKR